MAVESRFVVIRHGVEVQTFMDKKAADDYDKMLDMADNLTAMLDETPFELSDEVKEDLSIYLAQNREDVLVALQAKKAKPAPKVTKETPVTPKATAAPAPKVESTKVESTKVEPTKTSVEKAPAAEVETKPAAKKPVKRTRTKTKTASDIANTPAKETENAE